MAYKLIPLINDESDKIRRDIYVRNASELLGISEDTFRTMVSGIRPAKQSAGDRAERLSMSMPSLSLFSTLGVEMSGRERQGPRYH